MFFLHLANVMLLAAQRHAIHASFLPEAVYMVLIWFASVRLSPLVSSAPATLSLSFHSPSVVDCFGIGGQTASCSRIVSFCVMCG